MDRENVESIPLFIEFKKFKRKETHKERKGRKEGAGKNLQATHALKFPLCVLCDLCEVPSWGYSASTLIRSKAVSIF